MLGTILTSSDLETLNAKVEIYQGSTSTPTYTCTCADYLESFSLYREGDSSKLFGFGVVHRLECGLIDLDRVISLHKGDIIKIGFGNKDADKWDYPLPTLYITEISTDEKDNTISLTAHDKLYFASERFLNEIGIPDGPTTPEAVFLACTSALGIQSIDRTAAGTVNMQYEDTPNFTGDESFRVAMNAVAEVTGNIYFLGKDDVLKLKTPTVDSTVKVVNKAAYYELNVKDSIVLKNICSTTELGENLEPPTAIEEGVTQYLKENSFITLASDAAEMVEDLATVVQGITVDQVSCEWEGSHLLEIGDCVAFEKNDGSMAVTLLLNDVLNYSGYLNQVTEWEFTQDAAETATNSTSLGDRLNETYAKVNKLEKNITLYVSEAVDNVLTEQLEEVLPGEIEEATSGLVEDIKDLTKTTTSHTNSISQLVVQTGNIRTEVSALTETTTNITDDIGTILNSQTTIEEQVASLKIETDNVTTTVKEVQQSLVDKADKDAVETLTKQVETKVTSEQVEFIVTSELADGIDKVTTTSKRYTFDDEGLNISSSNSNISTTITEDGMNIKRQGEEVLVADNEGVKAEDLHATTYLIIGNNSRFEDYTNSVGEARTACFWIGG